MAHQVGSKGDNKRYDLILVGGSGFVGKLATAYILHQYGSKPCQFKWAISAHNQDRLRQTHKEIDRMSLKDVHDVPVIFGDVDDPRFADELASQARVIAATLTPYTHHGTHLVEACVRHRTHYVDLTGEMLWIRHNIDNYHDQATANKTVVVHACGLGSVPADLSVYLMNKRLIEDGVTPKSFKFQMGPVIGSLGGGTVSSYATAIGQAVEQKKLKEFLSPTLLAPQGSPVEVKHQLFIGYDKDLMRWTSPLWLAGLDAEIVTRSGALVGYGTDKQKKQSGSVLYTESQTFAGSGIWFLWGLGSAFMVLFASYLLATLYYFKITRIMLTLIRRPGSGPNRLIRAKGFAKAFLVARGNTETGEEVVYKGAFDIPQGDPGYQETAKMMIEGALALVLDHDRLPKHGQQGGVLTPASAFGEVLMERLNRQAGMTFTLYRS